MSAKDDERTEKFIFRAAATTFVAVGLISFAFLNLIAWGVVELIQWVTSK